ncbi:MAG: phosphoglucomutase [Ignavibacteriaceae bacterium]|nr:phosphoglucomutase [Ignavibacteriaceae bacterium]
MSTFDIKFGTDGWRGLLDSEVNSKSVATVAQAFADYLLSNIHHLISPRVVIGYDGRKNSDVFAKLFARVLSGNNIKVYLSNSVVPTPVVSYYIKENHLDAGVMITASHNPPEYSGIKFKGSYGGPFLSEVTNEVEKFLNQNLVQTDDHFQTLSLLDDYYRDLESRIDFRGIKKKKIQVLIDSMGGAGGKILENLLFANGIYSKTIFGEPDNQFYGRYPEPIAKNLRPLTEEIKTGDYSFGIATDGDADRVAFVLEDGEWLSAQETILILSEYLSGRDEYKGNIVKTSSVSDKLRRLENETTRIIDVQVGFKYICEEMIKGNATIGFEESGGFGIASHIPERDGILFALIMMELLADSPYRKLSEYVADFRKRFGLIHYDRIDLHYEKDDRISLLPELLESLPGSIGDFKIKSTSEYYTAKGVVNGIKFYLEGDPRWLLVRSSETEPLLRFYAEGENDQEVKEILDAGVKMLVK